MNKFFKWAIDSWKEGKTEDDSFFQYMDSFCKRHIFGREILLIGTGFTEEQYNDWPGVLVMMGAHHVHYLEVCKQYIDKLKINERWPIIYGDVRKIDEVFPSNTYDVIMWIHGPEHIKKEEIVPTFTKLCNISKRAVFASCPYGNYYDSQEEMHNNPFEKHIQKDLIPDNFSELAGFDIQTSGKKDSPDGQILMSYEKTVDVHITEFINFVHLIHPSAMTFLEIGSMDGGDCVLFKRSFPDSEVYAIEALPENYENIKKIKYINSIQAVISSQDENIKFHKKDINGLHGIYDRGSIYGTQVIDMPCFTLERILKENGIEKIDVMKIDVEGATFDVLKGMGNRLNEVKIMHIETESYPFFEGQKLHKDVEELLLNEGFELVQMSQVKINENGFQHDSVWVSSGLVSQLNL